MRAYSSVRLPPTGTPCVRIRPLHRLITGRLRYAKHGLLRKAMEKGRPRTEVVQVEEWCERNQ